MKCINPAGNYLFKFNNRNTITRCEIYSKITIKTRKRRQWRRSGVFVVPFKHIVLEFTTCSEVFIVNFQQVNAGWEVEDYDLSSLVCRGKKCLVKVFGEHLLITADKIF